jgi:ABC-type glycerol-3-phosphate transport system permease component
MTMIRATHLRCDVKKYTRWLISYLRLGDLTAYATLMTLPTLILFLALQRWFVKSLTTQV